MLSKKFVYRAEMVPEKHIVNFWEKYAKLREKYNTPYVGGRIGSYRRRTILPVSHNVMGTVREFSNRFAADMYFDEVKRIQKRIMESKPKRGILIPVQVLGIKENLVLERVYPSISFLDLKRKAINRFWMEHFRRIEKKGINQEHFEKLCELAYDELSAIIEGKGLDLDWDESNVLVLDYLPEQKKVVFGLIDIGWSKQTKH